MNPADVDARNDGVGGPYRWGASCRGCGTFVIGYGHTSEILVRRAAGNVEHFCPGTTPRLVIVGEQPNRSNGQDPLAGRAGRLLATLARVSESDWLSLDRRNLIPAWTERWDGRAASAAARRILAERPQRLVLCGRKVAAAFDVPFAPWLSALAVGDGLALILPHPSGRNRWWNDEWRRSLAAIQLGEFVRYGLDRGPVRV